MVNSTFLGIVNGVIGNYLEKKQNALAISMDLFYKNQPLKGDLTAMKEDFPCFEGHACLFLHGSTDSEQGWLGIDNYNYGTNLYDSFHILPLYLRYNSGLHISKNGQLLAELLNNYLTQNKIETLSIIGHSMGGLVFRSACYYAELHHFSWPHKIDRVFYLGSPHHGAPLEKFGAWTHSIIDKINNPYTKAIAKIIDVRSDGIKDLRHGYLIDEEWLEDQKDSFPQNRKIKFPLSTNVHHYVVAATLQKNHNSLISNWVGDLMVRKNSAIGKSLLDEHHLDFPKENTLFLGGSSHIKLRHHPKVNEFIIANFNKTTA